MQRSPSDSAGSTTRRSSRRSVTAPARTPTFRTARSRSSARLTDMRLLVVAAALVACGRGGQDDRKHDHGSAAVVASVSAPGLVPKLGISDDGVAALARL